MTRRFSLLVLAALAAAPALRAQSFQSLGQAASGAPYSIAYGVSDDGSVVAGTTFTVAFRAFRWTQATGMVVLGDLPGGSDYSDTFEISGDGTTIVGESRSTGGFEAFRWTEATGMVGLGDLPGGGFNSAATDVSDDGSVITGFGSPGGPSQAFRWTQATGLVGLPDLPGGTTESVPNGISGDGSVIVGVANSTNGNEAFRWTEATGIVGLGDLPGGAFGSFAFGVSDDGAVTVGAGSPESGFQAVRWTGTGAPVASPLLPGRSRAVATAIASNGVVVGYDEVATSDQRAVVWAADGTPYDLRDLLVGYGIDMTGWTLVRASDVSADGRVVVGYGFGPDSAVNELAWRAEILPLPTAAEEGATAPGLALAVAPNPARGAAIVTLTLDAAQAAAVTVYDLLGRPIATLHDGLLAAGAHPFRLDTAGLPAGVYVARAVTGGAVVTHRVTVVR